MLEVLDLVGEGVEALGGVGVLEVPEAALVALSCEGEIGVVELVDRGEDFGLGGLAGRLPLFRGEIELGAVPVEARVELSVATWRLCHKTTLDLDVSGGGGGIRTHGTCKRPDGFQDRSLRPLGHPSGGIDGTSSRPFRPQRDQPSSLRSNCNQSSASRQFDSASRRRPGPCSPAAG